MLWAGCVFTLLSGCGNCLSPHRLYIFFLNFAVVSLRQRDVGLIRVTNVFLQTQILFYHSVLYLSHSFCLAHFLFFSDDRLFSLSLTVQRFAEIQQSSSQHLLE